VKAVIVDSVSAIISPTLGGKQNEGTHYNLPCAPKAPSGPVNVSIALASTNDVFFTDV